jgi:sugar phosphate isomerase/epimerase
VNCRIAASTGCCIDRPILGVLDDLRRAHITAVEIGTPPRHFDPWQYQAVTALGDQLRQLSISPIAIHAPFGGLLDLTDSNAHHRHAGIGAVLSAASALRAVGGDRVVVHVSDTPRQGQNVEERLRHATDSFRVLARACAQMGMRLIIETPLPHLIGGDPDEFAAVVGPLDRSVGVCLDTSHATIGHGWNRFMELVSDRLVHLHANDHRGSRDDHLPPGEGIIDWRNVRDALERVGFDGWIVLELTCPPGPLGAYFDQAVRRTRELLAC